jgi:alpha-mannosidase
VKDVTLAASGRSAILLLANELPREGRVKVQVSGVRDLSPAGNTLNGAVADFAPFSPVYTQADMQTFAGKGRGVTIGRLPNLPTGASDRWTINMFVYTDKTPDELTLLGGFGDGADNNGAERFLIKFKNGIEFWGSNVDIASGVPLDLGKWQMVTATFDGATVRLYKNGQEIVTGAAELTAAEPTVRMGTRGPWSQKSGQFAGKISGFTIWDQALSPDYIKTLIVAAPK